jgi:hypothetical protein
MQIFGTAAAITAAPTDTTNPQLAKLLADRVQDWAATGLLDLTHLLLVEAGDTEEDIIEEIGFSPLVNPLDGRRFNTRGFKPHWDWLEKHDGFFEMIVTVSNAGFAFVLLISDVRNLDSELLQLCQTYAGGAAS